jgi:hypothetical protein
MYKRKTWIEKLNETHGLPKVEKIEGKLTTRWGTGTVAIPAPREVYEIMAKVPKGKLTTVNQIRQIIAKKHKATIGCPITCGIFSVISANAAEDLHKQGKPLVPYWRTLKSDGSINEKYPGGVEAQRKLLEKEEHKVIQKSLSASWRSKKYKVIDFEKVLIDY